MAHREIGDVIDDYTGNSRAVLEYASTTKRVVDGAKRPGFSAADWAPLAALVAVGEFERVGNFKEVMTWDEYVDFLTGWAPSAEWECSFKRLTESGNLVFLELEERSTFGDYKNVVNSVSVYDFNGAGKIRHIDVYLQMALPAIEILQSYEGITITE
ncbi:hypothetical protein E1200_01015 [Actinomadura sp. GC306]|uniref:hypothetical protein n=1 Tax=Actinomadura sp. GC306 TaxID=2530367 RepID=UPI001053583E|nr:hypothetical protein [Actinomadura sp. GC306]TDC71821.1 hypothetical protein E1200_01015 [Actinomadura sp. GC306]